MTYTEISTIKRFTETYRSLSSSDVIVRDMLDAADRGYMDNGEDGNYLEDFLAKYGEELIAIRGKMLRYGKGCPVACGQGLYFKKEEV